MTNYPRMTDAELDKLIMYLIKEARYGDVLSKLDNALAERSFRERKG